MTITLTHELEELVNAKVTSGDYESADDVIKAGLRLLQAREDGIEALRKEILLGIEDIEQGRFTTCESDEELDAFFDEIMKRGQERLNSRRARNA